MAETAFTTDALTVSPPLNARERSYLTRLTHSAGAARRPGYHCPWKPSSDGSTLVPASQFGTKEPLAEWAAYLARDLFGPDGPTHHGRALKGFTYNHVITGTVTVEGPAPNDRWSLECTPDGMLVRREHMPCASCWTGLLLTVRPTVAYRFIHPVGAANLTDGHFPNFDHDDLEAACLAGPLQPVGHTTRPVTWPLNRDFDECWWIDLEVTPDARPLGSPETTPKTGKVIPFPGAFPSRPQSSDGFGRAG